MSVEDLVLQGPFVDDSRIEPIAALAGAAAIERPKAGVVRLRDAQRHAEIPARCEAAGLDHGYVAPDARFAQFRLLAMDMDSTLITIECVDEIADAVGLKREVAAITAAAMRGEIEFRESLQRRVALLRGVPEAALQQVYDERLRLSDGAEALVAAARATGATTLLVSGGFTFFTDRMKARLALDQAESNVLEIADGKLTGNLLGDIVDAAGKAAAVRRLRATLGLGREQVLVVGDGANDLAMMAEGGVSIAYRAKPIVRSSATYSLNHVGLDGVLNLFP
jgi:phosphoserine phosphatase